MRKTSTKPIEGVQSWHDPLVAEIRPVIREAIERTVNEELSRALAAAGYARVEGRAGYRNGSLTGELGTPMGRVTVEVARARLIDEDGRETEWRSSKLPRYAPRMRGLDKAVRSIYLSGTNPRRVKAALRPLFKGLPLSKSAVSRLVARIPEEREVWMERDLTVEKIAYVYLDGVGVNVRRDGRVVRNPVLMTTGVRETGEKALLSIRVAGGETEAAWRSEVQELAPRGLKHPVLCILDGSPALRAAVAAICPRASVQRCTVHKLRSLKAHAPPHARELLGEDFHRIVYATSGAEARLAYDRFLDRLSSTVYWLGVDHFSKRRDRLLFRQAIHRKSGNMVVSKKSLAPMSNTNDRFQQVLIRVNASKEKPQREWIAQFLNISDVVLKALLFFASWIEPHTRLAQGG